MSEVTFRRYPRAKWHDYGSGIYFITVCTHNRINFFGKIFDGEILHTEIGQYLCRAIEECGLHYPGISVDRYVVMPNHFHAIIVVGSRHAGAQNPVVAEHQNATQTSLPTSHAAVNVGCLQAPRHPDSGDNFDERNHFNALLSRVLGGIKSAVTRHAHNLGLDFRWQANFHDHIIRNQREYDLIAEYIATNVDNWGKDKFYSVM